MTKLSSTVHAMIISILFNVEVLIFNNQQHTIKTNLYEN
jgi:exopolysaccharide biosynthesis predicted pyruvyltransferase EpsI